MNIEVPTSKYDRQAGLVHVENPKCIPWANVHAVFSIRTVKICACLCAIAKTSLTCLFCFFLDDFSTKFLENVAHLLDQKISAKKKRKTEVRPRDGHVEHVCKISWCTVSLKNSVDIWTSVRKNE